MKSLRIKRSARTQLKEATEMHGATFPRVPGLGLAPAMSTRHSNLREQDARLRDAIAREDAAYRQPCPPAERHEPVRRPARAGAA